MSLNKRAIIRYMYLDQMLSDRYNKYTCKDLLIKVNERLAFNEFSTIGNNDGDYDHYIKSGKRVIQMDLKALQDEPFNMEIDSSERLDGSPVYRYADQTQSIFQKQLSDDEKRLLREVLNTLGHFSGLNNFEWLDDLQQKLNDPIAFGRTEFDRDNQQKRKIISFSYNKLLEGKQHLGTLFSLIANKKVVDIGYEPFGQSVRTIRLYPYLLKQYNERWYLIGTPLATEEYPYNKDFYINLALDRIKSIDSVEREPYIDCEDDIEERFEDIIGVTYLADVDLTPIILAVKNKYVPYIETKPIHGSQTHLRQDDQDRLHAQHPGLDDYTFYYFHLKPNPEFKDLVSGDNYIVISPQELRDEATANLETKLSLIKGIR